MIDYVALARQSLSTWLREQHILTVSQRAGFPARCFVSLHLADGNLRGCIGTIEPVREDLVLEIIHNAISAGTRDPRFPEVSLAELATLRMEVSVLSPPQSISGPDQLDPVRYGLIVSQGRRRGVLLPDLPGVNSVALQLSITKQKAGIFNEDPVSLQRFEVEKYHESD